MSDNTLQGIADAVADMANDAAKSVALHAAIAVPAAWLVGGKDENKVGVFSKDELAAIAENVKKLAGFVRDNPLAPVESLWIYGAGRGFHPFPSTAFLDQPFWVRQCYRVFRDTIIALDGALAEEDARRAASEAATAPPPLAAALEADPRDTILELVADPLGVRTDAVLGPRVDPVVPPPADPDPVLIGFANTAPISTGLPPPTLIVDQPADPVPATTEPPGPILDQSLDALALAPVIDPSDEAIAEASTGPKRKA